MRFRSTIFSPLVLIAVLHGPALAQPVGVSAAVNPSTQGTPPGQAVRTITLGQQILHNELIETDEAGLLQVLLADGTTFTVGPSSRLTIDSFVYDPNAGTASLTASFGRGVFRFIGGRVSESPQGVTFNTPVGTAGIRGAIVDMDFGIGDGNSSYIVLRYGDEIVLERAGRRLARVYKAGYVIFIDEHGQLSVRKAPPSFTTLFQRRISGTPGSNGGAPESPTEETVTASGIQSTNSEYPLASNAAPTPRPPFGGEDVVDEANRDAMRDHLPESEWPEEEPDYYDFGG